MSRYRASSGDAMRSLTPRLSTELCAALWQEHGCPSYERHLLALYQFGASAVKHLSPGDHYGMDVVGNLADEWLHFQCEGCLNT